MDLVLEKPQVQTKKEVMRKGTTEQDRNSLMINTLVQPNWMR